MSKPSHNQPHIELQPISERINCLKIIPNTDYSVLGSETGRVSIIDGYSEKLIWAKKKHQTGVSALDIHPDGGLIYVGEKSGYGVLWDIRCPRVVADFYTEKDRVVDGSIYFF